MFFQTECTAVYMYLPTHVQQGTQPTSISLCTFAMAIEINIDMTQYKAVELLLFAVDFLQSLSCNCSGLYLQSW